MSTPIETNTEQLQEVLEQVYNLPSRSGGGDSYDLIIPVDMVSFESLSAEDFGEIDNTAVSATIAKLTNGENVKVLIRGLVNMDSGPNYHANIFPTSVCMNWNDRIEVHFNLPMDANGCVVVGLVELSENYISARSFKVAKS